MADVMNRVHVHLVWATWDRMPLLTPDIRAAVYRTIMLKAEQHHCFVRAIGGTDNHVHVLLSFSTTISIADPVKEMKGASSHLASLHAQEQDTFFKWQGTSGVFPVEPQSLPRIIRYIENQEQHHRDETLDPELEQTSRPSPVSPSVSRRRPTSCTP